MELKQENMKIRAQIEELQRERNEQMRLENEKLRQQIAELEMQHEAEAQTSSEATPTGSHSCNENKKVEKKRVK